MLHAMSGSKQIAITLPKRATTLAAARTGAMTLDVQLGQEVGYNFRGAPRDSHSDRTRVMYMTDGLLVAQARKDPNFKNYAAVLVDEAHERGVPTDFLLMALKNALDKNVKLKIVVMSATIDPGEFLAYFGPERTRVVNVDGAQMFNVAVKFNPIKFKSSNDLLEKALVISNQALKEASDGSNAILFVPTTRDAVNGCRIESVNRQVCKSLYGKMDKLEQDEILQFKDETLKTLYVATNVAESSLTLPRLDFVVDTGLQVEVKWDPKIRCTEIKQNMATRAQIMQRIGRVGRVRPGYAILLYSEKTFKELPQYPPPALLNIDLSEHILSEAASLNFASIKINLSRLLTPPSSSQVDGAFRSLFLCGLLTDSKVSELGTLVLKAVERFRLSLWNALVVCAGYDMNHDAGDLAAILEAYGSAELFLDMPGFDYKKYYVQGSDHATLLRIFRELAEPLCGSRNSLLDQVTGVVFAAREYLQIIRSDERVHTSLYSMKPCDIAPLFPGAAARPPGKVKVGVYEQMILRTSGKLEAALLTWR
ncbi:hypothetical protein CEUSTIGMA_g10728.t1 [Chlamydomonas eustigma]|uniref:RNA helicase n=1 Tax=Chlamydomonas eustigma TaxID=1157962 RepID=A0A250XK58_9CHLO|nr:hypothetical protein CEUSTIGMA_g10728.t1 [Chlamydomonas eustigma]|eukprot:GAX83302.1 hypothetical protein CEUSTIGMA_g10728.t1 [Chlamydomonas eustigma]